MITRDTQLTEALSMGDTDKMVEVLQSYGMRCFGCAMRHAKTVELAAISHGVDPDEMVAKLNECL